MNKIENKWYYIFGSTIFCVGILLKWFLSEAELIYFKWLLMPTVVGVEILTNLNFDFQNSIGFICNTITPTHIIDSSCSGFNFWLMAFWLGGFVLANEVKSFASMIKYICISFVLAWLLAIVTNIGRIVISIRILPLLDFPYETAHLIVGIFTYLPTLILYFWLLTSIQKTRKV